MKEILISLDMSLTSTKSSYTNSSIRNDDLDKADKEETQASAILESFIVPLLHIVDQGVTELEVLQGTIYRANSYHMIQVSTRISHVHSFLDFAHCLFRVTNI